MWGPAWRGGQPPPAYAPADPRVDTAAAERLAFWRGIVEPSVDGPVEAAELYHAPDANPLHAGHPLAAAIVLAVVAFIRLARFVRRRPQDVLVVVTPSTLVLLRASAGLSHGWRVDGPIGQWPRAEVRAKVGHLYELDLATPDGRRFHLTPAAVTPGAGGVAAAMGGGA